VTDQPLEPEEPAAEDLADDAEPTRIAPPPPPPGGEPEQQTTVETAGAPHETPPEPAPATESRRLLRSSDDRVIAGVCGGLGKYLGIDPVLVRIAALVLVFAGGAGILLYVIGWIAMPEEPGGAGGVDVERTSGAVILGFVFVVLGAFFLLDELWPDFLSWQYVWPIVLIGVGAAILLRARA
jgi:phage shock protein C